MKIVKQQLLHPLRETPVETDCSISVALLRLLQLPTAAQQQAWLERHRTSEDGKSWRCVAERWVFSAPREEESHRPAAPLFPRATMPPQKSLPPTPAPVAPALSRRVVKPLHPLPSAAPSPTSP